MLDTVKTFLTDNYLTSNDDVLAAALGVHVSSVRRYLRALKLRRRARFMEMPEEIPGETWRTVPTAPAYEASSHGRIREQKRGHLVQAYPDRYGYLSIRLSTPQGMKQMLVHRLVAAAFHGESRLLVNHKDTNKRNNVASNLEYVTHGENCDHARLNGLTSGYSVERITPETALKICQALSQGSTCSAVAESLGVPLNVAKKIRSRKTWTEISSPFSWK